MFTSIENFLHTLLLVILNKCKFSILQLRIPSKSACMESLLSFYVMANEEMLA